MTFALKVGTKGHLQIVLILSSENKLVRSHSVMEKAVDRFSLFITFLVDLGSRPNVVKIVICYHTGIVFLLRTILEGSIYHARGVNRICLDVRVRAFL